MKSYWQHQITELWYRPTWLRFVLAPFALIYTTVVNTRRWLYQHHWKRITNFTTPVIVVGNITVGGTGKTPLVIWLAEFLRAQGYQPGIVSRGYGGKPQHYPQIVTAESSPDTMGDEAVLLARLTQCPIVIDPDRVNAVKHLLANYACDIVISDDGLQHYALGRQIEIAVIDGERRLGNTWCLPAGPLREPASRLQNVDFIVTNGEAQKGEHQMLLQAGDIYNVVQPDLLAKPDDFAGQAVHAIAGIGNPDRFFRQLRDLGLTIWPHRFPDHHQFTEQEVVFDGEAKVIMTAKDAVKCEAFADYRYWCLPVKAKLDDAFGEALLLKLKQGKLNQKN